MKTQPNDQRRSDRHNNITHGYPAKSSTDNLPSSERDAGRDNLKMSMVNPRTVLSGFKFVGNSRGPVMDYAGGHNPGRHMKY